LAVIDSFGYTSHYYDKKEKGRQKRYIGKGMSIDLPGEESKNQPVSKAHPDRDRNKTI
jgi:hypothetical protein